MSNKMTAKNKGYGFELWSEVLPGLSQGGTEYGDWLRCGLTAGQVTKDEFDSVFTFFGEANPVDYGVSETRFAFYDGDMSDFDVRRDLLPIVAKAHSDWRSGKRVLIRCQAGLNRSGLVMALVLIRDGYTPEAAIALIREQRGEAALCNSRFENWLLTEGASPSLSLAA